MVYNGYKNNAIRNQKHFKPIADGNVAWLTLLKSHFHVENLTKNGSLNVNPE